MGRRLRAHHRYQQKTRGDRSEERGTSLFDDRDSFGKVFVRIVADYGTFRVLVGGADKNSQGNVVTMPL